MSKQLLSDSQIHTARAVAREWSKRYGDKFFCSAEFIIEICDEVLIARKRLEAEAAENARLTAALKILAGFHAGDDDDKVFYSAPNQSDPALLCTAGTKEEAVESLVEWALQEAARRAVAGEGEPS